MTNELTRESVLNIAGYCRDCKTVKCSNDCAVKGHNLCFIELLRSSDVLLATNTLKERLCENLGFFGDNACDECDCCDEINTILLDWSNKK